GRRRGVHVGGRERRKARALDADEAQRGVAVFFSRDGNMLVSARIVLREELAGQPKENIPLPREAVVCVHDVATGSELARWQWPVHDPDGLHLAMSPDGQRLGATMSNHSGGGWGRETGEVVRRAE